MILNLERNEICNIQMAITSVIINMEDELRDEDLTEERAEILERSIRKWQNLKSKIKEQREEQDNQ